MPFFRIIDESNFGEIKKDSKVIQVNLFSVSLGTKIYCLFYLEADLYLFSLWVNRTPRPGNIFKFGWGKIINLHKLQPKLTDQELSQKRDDFENVLILKEAFQKEILTNTILHKINDLQLIRGKSFNKFLAYLAIIALLIPIYLPYILRIDSIFNKPFLPTFIYVLSSIIILFSLVNVLFFSYNFLKVQTYRQFLFNKIKNASSNDETSIKYISGLYFDWQEIRNSTTKEVTLIKNMEKYLTHIVIWSIIVLVVATALNINNGFEKKPHTISQTKNEIHILDSSLDTKSFFSKSEDLLNNIQTGLLENDYKEIIIISNKEESTDNYSRIFEILKAYNANSTQITEIIDANNIIHKNQIQIIIIRR